MGPQLFRDSINFQFKNNSTTSNTQQMCVAILELFLTSFPSFTFASPTNWLRVRRIRQRLLEQENGQIMTLKVLSNFNTIHLIRPMHIIGKITLLGSNAKFASLMQNLPPLLKRCMSNTPDSVSNNALQWSWLFCAAFTKPLCACTENAIGF